MAESGTGVADPRVTITCANPCTTDAIGNLQATFSVSTGADNHFVVVASCVPPSSPVTGQCDSNVTADAGVMGFAVTQPVAAAAAAQPVLPRAGQPPPGPAPWAPVDLLVVAAMAAIGLAGGRGIPAIVHSARVQKMKKAAGRPKDMIELEILGKLREEIEARERVS